MTPADKEVLAILRRVLPTPYHVTIERIEREIEPCQDDNAASPKPVPQDATGNRGTSGSGAGSQPSRTIDPCPTPTEPKPSGDAIRQAFERLREVRGDPAEFAPDCTALEDAVDALLALDVPAAVDAQAYDLRHYRAAYPAMKQRAEAAEARVKELETRTAEDHDAICRQAQRLRELSQPGYADAVRRYEFANARAEAAEALADLAEGKCVRLERDLTEAKEQRDDALIRAEKAERELTNVALTLEVMSNGVKKAERERDAARKERDEARDKALEEAAVYLDTLKMYGTQAKLAAAIRAMKGKK